jgi:hypothetical protein
MTEKNGGATAIIWHNWQRHTRIDELPAECRPVDRVRATLSKLKSCASPAGGCRLEDRRNEPCRAETHRVDGPLAGPLLSDRVLDSGAMVPLDGNIMKVAEAEFCFRFGASLSARETPYDVTEVIGAVESLHPAIEVPDSRYNDFARVGAPQLIADTACACWFVLGHATSEDWRRRDLVTHAVTAYKNGVPAGIGSGARVLGDHASRSRGLRTS